MNKLNAVKRILKYIGYHNQPNPLSENVYLGNITDIFFNEDETTLTFVCLRPGLVIGKGGQNYDYVKSHIIKEIGEVEILIDEDRMWNGIYNN